jgi:hypothetical protein
VRKRRVLGALALAVLAIAHPRADLPATPDWRLADGITTALPAGDTVYVGGTFARLFTPASTENQFYDLVSGQPRAECARSTSADRTLAGYPDGRGGLLVPLQAGDSLADDAGVFTPVAGTTIVRITEACRWDRQFAAEPIDPSTPEDLTIGVPARVGGLVLASNAVVRDLFLRAQVASFDAGTGRRREYRIYDDKSEIGILGATATRVIVRVRNEPVDPYVLGAVDPVTLQLTESTTTLTDETSTTRSWIRGDTLYRLRPAPFNLLEAFDLTTLQARTGWTAPLVPGLVDLDVAGGRLFATARTVNGQSVPSPAALLAATGAIDPTWTPPALSRRIPDPTGLPYVPTLTAIATDGVRVYFSGDFERVGGVDRDGVAALAVAGAGLETWDPAPLLVAPLEVTTAALLATRPTGANRTDRRYLAAIDRATGLPTAWNPNDAAVVLQHTPSPVGAIAADATHVYFASATTGEVLRARRDTGEVDQTWRVAVRRAFGPGAILSMSVAGGVVYLGGEFDRISGTTFPATERQALAAVGADGRLLPWAPTLEGPAGSTLLRSMLVDGPTVYLGGDFTAVNGEVRRGFAAVDASLGGLAQPEMFVLGDTSVYGLATDGLQTYVAGVSFGAPLVGAVSVPDAQLRSFGPTGGQPPTSAAFAACRLYAGLEYDVDAGTPTARTTRWNRVAADDRGLVHLLDDGTIDYYKVIPGNVPGAPTLTGTSVGNTVSLSWIPAPSGGAPTSYTLRAGSAPGATDLATIPLRNTTTFSATAPTRLYYLTVVARNVCGPSAPSNEIAVQAGCVVAPPAPGPLTFTTAGATVSLAWGASATAASYTLEAGSVPGSSALGAFPLGPRTSFSASAPLGTYYVRVRAANDCGNSGPSNEVAVTLDGTTSIPGPPTALTAVVAGRRVTFTWTPPASGGTPASYVIEAGTTPGGVIANLPTTAPGLVVPNAPSGTFYVRVRAVNAAGTSPPTGDVTVVVP